MMLLLSLLACEPEPAELVPAEQFATAPERLAEVCDAGDEAWAARTLPLVWGRKPRGSAEVRQWASVASSFGRDVALRAMTQSPEYRSWWRQWFADALYVARTGDKAYAKCWEAPLQDQHDGSLSQHIRRRAPEDRPYAESFNMADVVHDALAADDVAVIYQAWLFARMNKPVQGANVSATELEYNRRVNFGEVFFQTYLNRNLDCVPCHNAGYSVTDSIDPALDRTWTLPGLLEQAVLPDVDEPDADRIYAMFRHRDLTRRGDVQPWGISSSCGSFNPSAQWSGRDFIDQKQSYFINELGRTGGVWQLERDLAAGADALSTQGLGANLLEQVDGDKAFAYMVGANLADLVWKEATGQRLTIAHNLSRNEAQATRLTTLTESLVNNGFSLRELLVSVVTDPYYNAGGPDTCPADPYGMEPVFNPWSIEDDDETRHGNGPGDLIHRHNARVLLNSAHDLLEWRAPNEFSVRGPEGDLQASIGVFLRESQPGFAGTDFVGLLTFERWYGTCRNPRDKNGEDWLNGVLDQARADNLPVGDVVLTLKDRLTHNGTLSAEETPLVEALIGESLVTTAHGDHEDGLRRLCGALLVSPAFQLAVEPQVGPAPPLGAGASCWDVLELVQAEGIEARCAAGRVQPPKP